MQCDTCRRLMPEALDGEPEMEPTMEFETHLETCSECRAEWLALSRVDSLLRAQPLLDPGPDFLASVMASVLDDAGSLPEWRRSLSQIGMIITGTLGIAWLVVSLSAHWRLADFAPGVFGLAVGGARGLALALDALAGAQLSPPVAAIVYAAAAAVMAFAWFGATILPRDARTPARRLG